MSHGFPIRCHTPFKHYLNFHKDYGCGCSSGGVCNSIWGGGSRTNITFNYNDGGFWGGFKYAMGGFFGSMLGGIFGGFMGNMFGGFGNMFGGFGMGGFMPIGNGGWGSWGGGWNSNNNASRTNAGNNNSSSSNNCEDKDQAKITELDKALNALDKTPDADKAKDLFNEISKLIKTPLDDDHKDENIKNYQEKLKRLQNSYDFNYDKNGNATSATQKNQSNGNGASTGAGASVGTGAAAPVAGSGSVTNGAGRAGGDSDNNPSDIKTKSDLDTVLATKADNEKNIAFIKTIPDDVKEQYYKSGYKNYDGKNEISNVKDAHDESNKGINDTVNTNGKKATITKASNGNHPATIVIHDKKDITYTYVGKAGSEYIYESDQKHQLYVLQKDSNGEFHLMQYAYMKGNGIPDWS